MTAMPIGKIGPDCDSYVPLNLGMMIILKQSNQGHFDGVYSKCIVIEHGIKLILKKTLLN